MKRLAYGEDDSSLWKVVTSFAAANQTALTAQELQDINGDATQVASYIQLISSSNTFSGIIIKFGKACNIEKIFLSFRYTSVSGTPTTTLLVEASADSTDGNGGTWTTLFTESHTIRAANSDSRLILQAQTPDEATATYTYLRVSWSASSSLNNLRLMSFWVYAEYSSPGYDFYDANGISKIQEGEILLGLFAGNAAVSGKSVHFKLKNNGSSAQTYTLTFTKVKTVADAVFITHIALSNDNSTKASTATLTSVAAGEFADFYVHIDIPVSTDTNGNLQDGLVHYGKITVTASGVTARPGFFIAVYYDTLANIELAKGIGLTAICLVCQRDTTDEGEIQAWSWWDVGSMAGGVTPVAACVQQEAVGNDIIDLLTSNGYVWEMDRNQFDNEEFAPEPVQMVWETVELPAKADPHVWRRSMWFDTDLVGADGGIIADYTLTALKATGESSTTTTVHLGSPAMRLPALDVGFQFRHKLFVYTGGKLSFKNFGFWYQDISLKGRIPYAA